MSTFPYNKEQI